MGCTKCSIKSIFEFNKETEIIYSEPNHRNPNVLKKVQTNFILETLNTQMNQETQQNKNELPVEEEQKLVEMTKEIKMDKRKMRLLRKCQSHILGMQLRKKIRVEKLKKSETIDFDLLVEKELPLHKGEIIKFFEDYPPKAQHENLKLEKKEPLVLENRIIYYGEWDMNFFTKHGRGIQIWPDGSYYKGYWENHKAEGKGEFYHSSGDIYIGNWHNNKRQGKGVYHSKKGMEYDGYWKNDKQEGKGKETWEDGSTYTGCYSNGKRHGIGLMVWANGCQYNGNFENGNINGKGVYRFFDNRVYEGDFVNNVFEGKGIFTWPNGNKYHGNFKNDKRDGFGIFTFSDGRIYKGIWKKGKQDGEFDVYNPRSKEWSKKKFKEYKEEKKIDKKLDKRKSRKMQINDNVFLVDEDDEQEENEERPKIIEDTELEKIDEILKTEENKIDELDEEF